jgi:predicted permease
MLSDLRYRWRAIFRRGAMEHDLATELQLHFEREVAKLVDDGASEAEAQRRARLAMGGIDQVKEQARDAWGVRLVDSIAQDIAYAFRVLGKSPGFTAAVALSLALGIGANTAIFTLMDAVMWRMLPVNEPEHLLVAGRQQGPTLQTTFNYGQFRHIRDDNTVADLAGYAAAPINVSVDGPPEAPVQGQLVTGDYFRLLGVNPVLGRTIGPEDDRAPNGHPVVVLSYGYWTRRFARDPSVIGRTIRLSAATFTIVGVTPPEFFGVEIGTAPDLFVPIMMQPMVMPAFENLLEKPINSRPWVQIIARTRPGITSSQAAAAMDAVFRAQEAQGSGGPKAQPSTPARLVLTPATAVSALRRQFSRPLVVLLAMVGVVLLIACANTANLLLARAAARRPEFAMRLALGAGRQRLMRQVLVEGLVLAGLGGVCGVLLAGWATRLLVLFMSSGRTPISLDLTPNVRILAFTAVVSVLTGVLFGLAPAWRATRIDLVPALKHVRDPSSRTLSPHRMLSISQLVLSLLLLIAAGLFVRSLQKLNGDDTAGLRQSVVMLRVEPKGSDQRNIPGTAERLDRIYRELIRRAQEMPDVRFASMGQITPTAPSSNSAITVRVASGEQVRVPMVMVYPDYFATIGMPIISGRDFGSGDLGEHAPAVCVVNESFARQVFAGENPLGKPCLVGRRPGLGSSPEGGPPEPYTIVGVVKDSRYSNPRGESQPLIYGTFLQTSTGRGQMVLHVRVTGNTSGVAQRIRQQVAAVDPAMPMFDAHTLEEEMNAALVQQRLIAMLSSLFGALALLLACVGLYGLLAFAVIQRRSEIGIRMALGAQRSDVVSLVVREAMLLVAIGIAIGVPAALVVARMTASQISGLLFGLEATDPLTIGVATVTLASVAALAAYLPARRASRVDPMLALRTE